MKRGRKLSAAVEVPIGGPNDRAVRLAGNDLNAVEKLAGALQNGRERQRKIHHGSAHKVVLFGIEPAASYHYSIGHGGSTASEDSRKQRGRGLSVGICWVTSRPGGLFPIAKEVNFREDASDR